VHTDSTCLHARCCYCFTPTGDTVAAAAIGCNRYKPSPACMLVPPVMISGAASSGGLAVLSRDLITLAHCQLNGHCMWEGVVSGMGNWLQTDRSNFCARS
jgi:hypothetical protein